MTFNWLQKPHLQKLPTKDFNGSRHYCLPDGTYVPSVTTILGKKKDKDLKKWVEKVGEAEATKRKNHGARRGNSIHDMLEKYVQNDLNYLSGVLPHFKEVFFSLRPYLDKIDNIWYSEETVYSQKLGIAGRLDLIAEYDGILSLIDLKGATYPRKSEHVYTYFLQLAMYSMCFYEMTNIPIKQGVVLMGVENNLPQIWKIKTGNYILGVLEVIRDYKQVNPLET